MLLLGAVHILSNSLKRERASGICYMRYMRERGVFVLMLYNAVVCICIILTGFIMCISEK